MIVVDTSALMAIILNEPEAAFAIRVMEEAESLVMSAGTLAEALIVARRRGAGEDVARLVEDFAIAVVPVTQADAMLAADAYDCWGKGVHPARLNLGDCFAYALARARDCPLLFVGDDFARTDIVRASAPPA